jgi:hypothetical protein
MNFSFHLILLAFIDILSKTVFWNIILPTAPYPSELVTWSNFEEYEL